MKTFEINSNDTSEPLTAEEQAVLVAIDPVNQRLYARTPSNASPARADTPIPDLNANDDQREDENELDDKIDENEPDAMVNVITFDLHVDMFVRLMLVVSRVSQIHKII